MKAGAIIQARVRSTRLAEKVLMKLPHNGTKTVLQHIASRAARSKLAGKVLIATSDTPEDDKIAEIFPSAVFRGDAHHVLRRFYLAAGNWGFDPVVRLTGDNPCLDPECIDRAVESHMVNGFDYTRTTGLPLGMNVEVVSFDALSEACRNAVDEHEIEHVTPFVLKRPQDFRIGEVALRVCEELRQWRLTLDYPSDYALLNIIFAHFGERGFSLKELEEFSRENLWLRDINRKNYQKASFETPEQELATACEFLRQMGFPTAVRILRRLIEKKPEITS
jgi:spore coat polysaccharide biosynthesis protein SpsF (cytidylyltransferase family)